MEIYVVDADIAQLKADALLTAVNSAGMWFGGIDSVIGRSAGRQFHNQAAAALQADPTVKVVVAPRQYAHEGWFDNVVFTIDNVDEPLKDVVLRGLNAAADAGYKSVSMPAVRLGVMKSHGGTQTEKVQSIIEAVREHQQNTSAQLDEVTIVTYNDTELTYEFIRELA